MNLTAKHRTSLSLTHTYLIDKNGQMRWGEEEGTCLKDSELRKMGFISRAPRVQQ